MVHPLDLFHSKSSHVLLNPRLPTDLTMSLRKAAAQVSLPSHVWLMSSGTESAISKQTKLVGLSHQALLAAAQGVADTFSIVAEDIYLNPLPVFHVGGLSIWARAHLTGCKVIELGKELKWDANRFMQRLDSSQATLTSLVPTQIHDLVTEGKKSPAHLRLLFVGGGGMSPQLYDQANELGWPMVLTYGMTETCAMLAYAWGREEGLMRLPHIEDWRVGEDSRLAFQSKALLTTYLFVGLGGEGRREDPKKNGWYESDDCGEIRLDRLYLKGRESELVKIKGESVSLVEMQNSWSDFLREKNWASPSFIVAQEDARDGYILSVVAEAPLPPEFVHEFNAIQLPFCRLRRIYQCACPTTPLGKISRHLLVEQLAALNPLHVVL